MAELILVELERFKELQQKEGLLTCLETLGIKKWQIYKEAQDMLEQSMGESEVSDAT